MNEKTPLSLMVMESVSMITTRFPLKSHDRVSPTIQGKIKKNPDHVSRIGNKYSIEIANIDVILYF